MQVWQLVALAQHEEERHYDLVQLQQLWQAEEQQLQPVLEDSLLLGLQRLHLHQHLRRDVLLCIRRRRWRRRRR